MVEMLTPSGVTNAYAIGARLNGAEIYRFLQLLEQNKIRMVLGI